ncbi:MAG: hypothetical protein GMKNLPBB_01084 [Myxococcota bacterium]|nr:hypothetical protein [Myxococcota bacterium]
MDNSNRQNPPASPPNGGNDPDQALPPEELVHHPYYPAALLKVSMEISRNRYAGLEEIIQKVIEGTDIDPDEFRKFVTKNMNALVAIAQKKNYT